jgi:glycosyltransferase involved in cell wall biosynthesis
MKILLIGEYSNLHNSLKKGLLNLGHEVILLGSGDGFKKYDVDILIKSTIFENKFLKIIAKIIDKVFKFSLNELEIYFKSKKIIKNLADFDIVQLINERPFNTSANLEISLLKHVFKNNEKVFLLACGVDHKSISYANDKKFKYSILTPYFENNSLKKEYRHILKYLDSDHSKLSNYIEQNIQGIISSDLDYHIPYLNSKKYLGMIPNPIDIDTLNEDGKSFNQKIVILHAINSKNKLKKGNKFFKKSLSIIEAKYSNKVEIIRTTDLAYSEHIKNVKNCDILLDQVYAYDQGYNALEAMAMGKVVLTGAEKEWREHYNIVEDYVVINAMPDVSYLVEKLSWLIENPEKIKMISKNAREFILKYHDYNVITKKYLKAWEN